MEIILKYFTDLTEKQLRQFNILKSIYEEWNAKINVISRKDLDNFYLHHVLHSLSIAAQFNLPAGFHVLDIGTGGGFPGIPLAIFFPEVKFHLVDSIAKKLKVVEAVTNNIGVNNVTISHKQAELMRNRNYDTIVSRAVAPLKKLWEWGHPLLKKYPESDSSKGTGLICLKGGDLNQEISESGCKPKITAIEKLFDEPYFKDKFILQVIA
jgi:16S rRNA (guanine527-N7)-methyltransferase